jgi:hypothetical protein
MDLNWKFQIRRALARMFGKIFYQRWNRLAFNFRSAVTDLPFHNNIFAEISME